VADPVMGDIGTFGGANSGADTLVVPNASEDRLR
jgi:hypothetical protein